MEKKRDKANKNIEILIEKLIDARKEALGSGNCPYYITNKPCISNCCDCKDNFFEKMKEKLLEEYIVMNDMWNIILFKLDGNTLISSENNPTESGRYLCTCIRIGQGEEQERYLQIMEYDASKHHWHDCGNKSGISHNILAWTDKIIPCDFTDFDCIAGVYFVGRT